MVCGAMLRRAFPDLCEPSNIGGYDPTCYYRRCESHNAVATQREIGIRHGVGDDYG